MRRLDKDDLFPLSVILVFALAIPIPFWVGFGSWKQIVHDFFDVVKYLAFVCAAVMPFIVWFNIRLHKRERRFLKERGEQSAADFVALFRNRSEQIAATLLFHTPQSMTAMGHVPTLRKDDQLHGPPLFLVPDDLSEELEGLCEELDICTALDPDAGSLCTMPRLFLNLSWHWVGSLSSKG